MNKYEDETDSKKLDLEECESDFSNYVREYSTIYEVIVSKIKYTSKLYISLNEEYLGKKYDSSNESQL